MRAETTHPPELPFEPAALLAKTAEFVVRRESDRFYQDLVAFCSTTYGCAYAHVALLEGDSRHVRVIAGFLDGADANEGYVYSLTGTPCENVISDIRKCYTDDVQSLFPLDNDLVMLGARSYFGEPLLDGADKVAGLVALVFRHALEEPGVIQSCLKVLAARASAVLSREAFDRGREADLKRLVERESRFRSVFDSIFDAIFLHDMATGQVLQVNRRMCEMYGCTEATALQSSFKDASANIPPYSEADALGWLQKAVAEGPQTFEWLARRLDNHELFWTEVSLRVTRIGETDRILAVVRDISARKAAESALRASETRFQRLFENVDAVAIQGYRRDGSVAYWNRGTEALYGYTAAEALQGNLLELIIPESMHSEITAAIHWMFEHNQGIPAGRLMLRHKAGHLVPVWSSHTVLNVENQDTLLFCMDIDLSELEQAEAARQESEALLRTVIDENPHIICMKDANGRFLMGNRALASLYNTSTEALVGKDDADFIDNAEQAEFLRQNVLEVMAGGSTEIVQEDLTNAVTGEVRHFQAIKKPLKGPDGESRILVIANDVTDLTLARARIEESERRLSYALDATGEGLWDWDLTTGLVKHNRRWCELLGFQESMLEHPATDYVPMIHEGDRQTVCQRLQACRAGKAAYQSQHRMRRQDGRIIWVLDRGNVVERDADGNATRMVGSIADISDQHLAQAQIQHLAMHDALTQLPNRNLARERFARAASNAGRSKTKVALLFLDLDHFKNVNDTLGHHVGDMLLQQIAARLTTLLRDSDIVSRQGGDEFVVVLTNLPEASLVATVAGNILNSLDLPFVIGPHTLHTSFSIGISMLPDDGRDFDTLLQKADTAMYSAKSAGRNAYHFFSQTMNDKAAERMQIQNLLRGAQHRGELHLYYQPQIDLVSNSIVGCEALIRWNSPELGFVAPDRFIPIAEETGLIVPIGEWVVNEACRQASEWTAALGNPLTMSVNLSAVQFHHGSVVATIQSALERSGFDPALLEVELTESVLLKNPDAVVNSLHELADLGVSLAIDDFGTGYSSLSYLKMLPVRRLKIDKSFVRDMLQDQDDASIVLAIVQMAGGLRLKVIAEGVESLPQADWLLKAGCSSAQGYLFGRPMPANDFLQHIRSRQGQEVQAHDSGSP
ncbi:MAG: EAL domain-containing protein [Sulfuritalea sp.]|nr:EAL domain-containing protein [Sulfuritalea sp.]